MHEGGALTRRWDGARIDHVRFVWQRPDLARTCEECGYTWRVPRSAAKRRLRSISMFNVAPNRWTLDRGELAREVTSISAANRTVETYEHCPRCGADRFTEHAVRDDDPPG
jgi:DNA-directed RNA polymerase subunit M/transcription elongation factor TFIIS